MLREIVKATSQEYILHIPMDYLNREIEILILPFSREAKAEFKDDSFCDRIKKTSGMLKNKINDPVQWQKDIRGEWDKQ